MTTWPGRAAPLEVPTITLPPSLAAPQPPPHLSSLVPNSTGPPPPVPCYGQAPVAPARESNSLGKAVLAASPIPGNVADHQELDGILGAQMVEIEALKVRLYHLYKECSKLRRQLKDHSGELLVTSEATAEANERLEVHAGRHGLVLAAGVERCNAERAALEDELQLMEKLLWDRDQEIKRLRRVADDVKMTHFDGEVQLLYLAYANKAASNEVRTLGANVAELQAKLLRDQATHGRHVGPSDQEASRFEDVSGILKLRQGERQDLARRAEALAADAKRLEAESKHTGQRAKQFEQELRAKQKHFAEHDDKLLREAASLQLQGDDLRRHLYDQQRTSAGLEQRAVLHDRAGQEAQNVQRELSAIQDTLKGLGPMLRQRGQTVFSPEVTSDHIDCRVHQFLRNCSAGMDVPPPIMWRLGPGQYILGEDRVTIGENKDGILVVQGKGGTKPIRDFVMEQTQRATSIRADVALLEHSSGIYK